MVLDVEGCEVCNIVTKLLDCCLYFRRKSHGRENSEGTRAKADSMMLAMTHLRLEERHMPAHLSSLGLQCVYDQNEGMELKEL